MKRILAASDFSTRSDRATRRATLIAKTFGVPMTLVHVVDDDQPHRILKAEQKETSTVLKELAQSVRSADGVECESKVVLGEAFEGIVKASDEVAADLIVLGEHRRQILRDIFVGTTAERTIRTSRRPVLMATAVPTGFYRHVLIAVDMSNASRDAIQAVRRLGFDKYAAVSVIYVFDAIGTRLMSRTSLSTAQINEYVETERDRAAQGLSTFLRQLQFEPAQRVLKLDESSPAGTICSVAEEIAADLIVVGTGDRTAIAKLMLGSVTEELLRISKRDVLAVPGNEKPDDTPANS